MNFDQKISFSNVKMKNGQKFFFQKKIPLILWGIIISMIALVTILVGASFHYGYFATTGDEAACYNFGRAFLESSSLQSPSTLCEQVSVVGKIGWYGPFYNIIYGILFKTFGLGYPTIIGFNYVLFLLCLLTIKFLPLNKIKRLIYACLFLSLYIVCPFVLSGYPETLHILLTLVLLLIYSHLNKSVSKSSLYLFISAVFICALMRSTFMFWIISILFLHKSPVNIKTRLFICLLFIITILAYVKFFQAPSFIPGLYDLYYNNNESIVYKVTSSILHLLKNGLTNFYQLYNQSHSSVIVVLVIFSIASCGLLCARKKNGRSLELGLISVSLVVFIALLFLYTTKAFFFEKQIGFILPLLLFCILKSKKNISLILLISCTTFLPYSMIKSINTFLERRASYTEVISHSAFTAETATIFSGVKIKSKEVYVLLYYQDFIVGEHITRSFLPLHVDKSTMHYTNNTIDTNDKTNVLERKFHKFNVVTINYILSVYPLDLQQTTLVKSTEHFYLYETAPL